MKRIPTSIIHGIGFCMVLLISLVLFARTAVIGVGGTFNKLLALLQFRETKTISCQLPELLTNVVLPAKYRDSALQVVGRFRGESDKYIVAKRLDNVWNLDIINVITGDSIPVRHGIPFRGERLTVSYRPISDRLVYPECDKETCRIVIWSVAEKRIQSSIEPIDSNAIRIIDLDNLFFDSEHSIISYTTNTADISSRLVINDAGELLQSIDESPGDGRQLAFKGYNPDQRLLVYLDSITGDTYYYGADTIFLSRRHCK